MQDQTEEQIAAVSIGPPIEEPLPSAAPLPSNLDLGGDRASRSSDLTIETPKVEDRTTDIGSLLGRIRARVAGAPDSDDEPKRKARKPTKQQQSELQEAARILLVPLLIFAVTQSLGEIAKPTQEEAEAFIDPLARVIARHVPIPEHLSADVIDLLTMTAAGVTWWTRVSPQIPPRPKRGPGRRPTPSDGRGPRAEEPLPVEDGSVFDQGISAADFMPEYVNQVGGGNGRGG